MNASALAVVSYLLPWHHKPVLALPTDQPSACLHVFHWLSAIPHHDLPTMCGVNSAAKRPRQFAHLAVRPHLFKAFLFTTLPETCGANTTPPNANQVT